MEQTELNRLKYENYKEQFKRLDRALKNGFNLEAMFIEYAMMEDRTESVLRHADLWEKYLKHLKGRTPSIDSKIKYIGKAAEQKGSFLYRYFSDDFLSDLISWKEERNRLIHALLKQNLAPDEISSLALEGKNHLVELKKRSGNFKSAIERRKAK